jgi:DNA repair protein RadC
MTTPADEGIAAAKRDDAARAKRGGKKASKKAALEARSENAAVYAINPEIQKQDGDDLIAMAIENLQARLRAPGPDFGSPTAAREYLILTLAEREHEIFGCLFLDNRHRLIAIEEMFRGTLNGTAVYPREVAKRALAHNSAAVIFFHNHPSGDPDPSRADEALTQRLKEALAMPDIRTLDHIIVGGSTTMSFAERGML